MGIYKLIKLVLNSLNEDLRELGMIALIAAYIWFYEHLSISSNNVNVY